MKLRSLFIIPLLFFSLDITAQPANTQEDRKNYLYAGSFDVFLNTFLAGYERTIKNNSVAVLAGFKLTQREEINHRIGGNVEVQYRINMMYNRQSKDRSGHLITFPYFAPFIMYRYEEITEEPSNDLLGQKTIVNSAFGGAGFGLRLHGTNSRFTMNVFTGLGMKFSDNQGSGKYDGFLETAYTGLAPKFGLQLGIAF
jgi:hypothetical protein